MTWKYYAVAVGRQTGIFQDWESVKILVNGYNGAVYKGFKSKQEAEQYLQPYSNSSVNSTPINSTSTVFTTASKVTVPPIVTKATSQQLGTASMFSPTFTASPPSPIPQVQKVIAYTDGSYRDNRSGYGCLFIFPDKRVIHGYGHVPIVAGNTNNVAELYAIYVAVSAVPNMDIDIYTDSEYSINVITGVKRAHINIELIQHIQDKIAGRKINFYHVYGHSGVHLNETVDGLANQGSVQTDDDTVWFQPYPESSENVYTT